jgi:hypothetical protein
MIKQISTIFIRHRELKKDTKTKKKLYTYEVKQHNTKKKLSKNFQLLLDYGRQKK